MNIKVTNSQVVQRVFKNMLSMHEGNIKSAIKAQGWEAEIFDLMIEKKLIFRLKDVSSWQRQYNDEIVKGLMLEEERTEIYEVSIRNEKIYTNLSGELLTKKEGCKTFKDYFKTLESKPRFKHETVFLEDVKI